MTDHERKVVVYVRVGAIDLATVALWMKQNNIYRMAKPGGAVARAVKILADLLVGQGLVPRVETEEMAEHAFGMLNFPDVQFSVNRPMKLAVQASGLATMGRLHAAQGVLERGAQPEFGEYRENVPTDDLTDDELNVRQAIRDAEQKEAFEAQMGDIIRRSVLAGSTTLTRERYNEKYPASAISEEELAAAIKAKEERNLKEAEDAPKRKAALIAREDALIAKEKEERKKRKEALALQKEVEDANRVDE